MKKTYLFILVFAGLSTGGVMAETTAINKLLNVYKQQGATTPNVQAGQRLWHKTFTGTGQFSKRSCTSCHGDDLKRAGKHVKTNKIIKPMAPSVNPERLGKKRNIRKWFKRNCKWTLGRECTATEKANLLVYLSQQ